jgi:hypothetical protein
MVEYKLIKMNRLLRWIRLTLGISQVPEVCEASSGENDYHDYPINKGGDGGPLHFHKYTCWNCGKRFEI